MADKTLYDILEVGSGASPEIIRAAYDQLSAKFDTKSFEDGANPDLKIQHDAVKEAFLTLGNPVKRAQYDKKLGARYRAEIQYVEIVNPFWTVPKLMVVTLIVVIGGGYYYSYNQTKVKLAAEKAIAEVKAQEAVEKARAEAKQTQLEIQRQQQERFAEERARRESAQALQRFSMEQQANSRSTENYAIRERQDRERANIQRQREEQQAAAAARAQIAREKAELCRMERDRYGRSISC